MTFLLQSKKMPRGNKGQGKKVAVGLLLWRSQRPKCGCLLCLRKGLTNSVLDRTSSTKETPFTSSDDCYTSQQLAKAHPSQDVQRTSCHWSVHPDPGPEQLSNCLILPTITLQRQSWRKNRGCWSKLRKQLVAKGLSPRRDHLSSEQRSIQSPPLVGNKQAQMVVIVHNADPTELWCRACPVSQGGVPYCIIRG